VRWRDGSGTASSVPFGCHNERGLKRSLGGRFGYSGGNVMCALKKPPSLHGAQRMSASERARETDVALVVRRRTRAYQAGP